MIPKNLCSREGEPVEPFTVDTSDTVPCSCCKPKSRSCSSSRWAACLVVLAFFSWIAWNVAPDATVLTLIIGIPLCFIYSKGMRR